MARVLISIPEKFLEMTDEKAKEESRSRSELIREALRQYISDNERAKQNSKIASKINELIK